VREAPEPRATEGGEAGRSLSKAALVEPAGTPLGRAAQVCLQLLLVAAGIALVGYILLHIRLVVLPVLAALFLATVLMPISDAMRSVRVPPALAAFFTILAAALLFAGITALLAPPVANELGDLEESFRAGLAEVGSSLENVGISQEEIDNAIDDGLQTLEENSGPIGQGIVTGALLVFEVLAGILLGVVLLFFFLKDGDRIWSWLVSLVPPRRREDAHEVGRRGWSTLGHYLRGVALVALFDAVVIGAALAILGVPLVLPLAVLTFFSAFFPLVGAVTAGFVAALVALVSEGPVTALIVVAVITAVQQLEGDVIYPVVVGRSIELHPVAILLVLTAGAVVAGVIGALFAVPIAAVIWGAVKYLRGEDEEDEELRPHEVGTAAET
jgi:putative heme transporter